MKTVIAVIGDPRKKFKSIGSEIRINAVIGKRETRPMDLNAVEVRNVPGLDLDYIVQHFYLSLTEKPDWNADYIKKNIPITLIGNPPLSEHVKQLTDGWFKEVRTDELLN